MSLYASVESERIRATLDGPRRATCLDCSAEMLAKTGNVVVHHWAHRVRPLDCQAAHEGEWHLAWKGLALDGTQEIAHPEGKRRADVLAPGGFAVEFQASPLTADEVHAREADWDRKLVWVFDAREAYQKNKLRVMGAGKQRGLFWFKAPERIKAARCPTYYDLGTGNLIRVGELRQEKTSLKGRGWCVGASEVVANVLRGKTMPSAPIVSIVMKPRGLKNVPPPTGWLYLRMVVGNERWVQVFFRGNPELVAELDAQLGFHCGDHIVPGSYLVSLSDWQHSGHAYLVSMFEDRVQWALPHTLSEEA